MIVFLGPAALLLLIGLVDRRPFQTTYQSFQDANGKEFVGLANYRLDLHHRGQSEFLLNTALWIIIAPLFSTGIGLMLALLLDRMRRESISKSLIFMPMAISFVGAGSSGASSTSTATRSETQVGLLSAVVSAFGITPENWLLCSSRGTTSSSWSS